MTKDFGLLNQELKRLVDGIEFRGGLLLWRPRLETRVSTDIRAGIVFVTISVPPREDPHATQRIHVGKEFPVYWQLLDRPAEARRHILECVAGIVRHEVFESMFYEGQPIVNDHPGADDDLSAGWVRARASEDKR